MHYCDEQVYLYFYGELKCTSDFRKHLSKCCVCQERLCFLEKMSQAMDFEAPQVDKITRYRKIFTWSVVAAVLLFGFFSLFSFVKKLPEEKLRQHFAAEEWSDLDVDIDRLQEEIERFSRRNYKVSLFNVRRSKIKRKIIKLKNAKIW